MNGVWWELGIAFAILALVAYGFGPVRWRYKRVRLMHAQHGFHLERERLEMRFVQLVTTHSQPDAPRWRNCAFADDVAYVRSRSTGELSALVAVTVAAKEGGLGSHGNADVISNLQAGTAIFRFDGKHWATDGKVILDLSPRETIRRFRRDFELLGEESAQQRIV